jgi:nitrate reductase beta subunit
MIHVCKAEYESKCRSRGPGYREALQPAIVAKHPDGSIDIDETCEAWRAFVRAFPYRKVGAFSKLARFRSGICAACEASKSCALFTGYTSCYRKKYLALPNAACPMNKWGPIS